MVFGLWHKLTQKLHHRWVGYVVAFFLLSPAYLVIGTLGILWIGNTFSPSTVMFDPYISGSNILHVGDIISVRYYVIRFQTCKLEIIRLFRRNKDLREIQIDFVIQPIKAEQPPTPRLSGYEATIPSGVLNPGEDEAEGEVFSRVQYFCNELDYHVPRVVNFPSVPLKVLR